MGNSQIPNLPAVATMDVEALFEAVQGGQSVKVSARQIAEAFPDAVTFTSRASLVSYVTANTFAVGTVFFADGLFYQYTTAANSIPDMPGWEPAGDVYPGHFGAVGALANSSNQNNFDDANVTVDETALLRNAFDYCLSNGYNLIGDSSRVYGITFTLVWGARTASGTGSVVLGFPDLIDLNLKVIGGTWTSGIKVDPDDVTTWTWGNAALIVGKNSAADSLGKFRVGTNNVFVDGNHLATGGIWYRGASQRDHIGCRAVQFRDYQIRIGESNNDGRNCTDASFYACVGAEWTYVDSGSGGGYNDYSLRTAVGLLTEGSDVELVSCTFSSSLVSLVYNGGYNTRFTACKFWNGQARTDPTSKTAWISTEIGVWNFDACRFDDGYVLIEAFLGRIGNTRFMQSDTPGNLKLRANAANEKAEGLVIFGNTFSNEISPALLTKGVGTWGAIIAKIGINTGGSAGVEYSLDGVVGPVITEYSDAGTSFRSTSSININANWQGAGTNVRREIRFANQGVVHNYFNHLGYRFFGFEKALGGGNILRESYGAANQYLLEPVNAAGTAIDSAARLEYNPAKFAWSAYANLVAASDFVVRSTAPITYAIAATIAVTDLKTTAVIYSGAVVAALTLPLGTALDTAFPDVATNQGFDFSIICTAAGAATLTANTGVTIIGSAVVSENTSSQFRLRKTGVGTWVAYRRA